MRLRVQSDHFTTLLLAALGFAPSAACGGAFATNTGGESGSGGQAGNGAGGDVTSGAGGDLVGTSTGVGGYVTSGAGGYVGVGGSVGQGGSSTNPFPCITGNGGQAGAPPFNGYQQCQNGLTHRTAIVECPSSLPRPVVFAVDGGVGAFDGGLNSCQRDTDCVASPHGYCGNVETFAGPRLGPQCSYGCVRDQECGMNQICVCGNPVGHCESATCTVDSECVPSAGPGFVCASYVPNPGCPGESFACQTQVDQCATDADCMVGRCTYQQGHRMCSTGICAVGRPFLVDGAARMASRGSGDAWRLRGSRPNAAQVSPEFRARLAEAWTKVGLMEHASIAAFARFTLQLMSLGAPSDLVERSNAATCDETLHARLAFSIASAYAGRDVGPGPLDVRGALDGGSLREILINVIREGCIGETVAAVEAAEALEYAVDPVVRNALARIAKDELRHADLAWQFVRWAIEHGDEELRDVARREFEAARASSTLASGVRSLGAVETALLGGGILPDAMKREVHATTVERVVLVCARALLELPAVLLAAS